MSERKLNEPYRWNANAMTSLEVSAVRVVDTEACMRVELFSRAHGGERMVQGIDVPFLPTAMHIDCISLKNHERKVERAVTDAVAAATKEANARVEAAEARAKAAEARIAAVEEATNAALTDNTARSTALIEENDALRKQSAALNEVMAVVSDIDRLNLLFLHRPAFANTLRTRLKVYNDGNFDEYVTLTAHKTALDAASSEYMRNVASSVRETLKKLRKAFEACALKLSAIGAEYPQIDVKPTLDVIEDAIKDFDNA